MSQLRVGVLRNDVLYMRKRYILDKRFAVGLGSQGIFDFPVTPLFIFLLISSAFRRELTSRLLSS